MTPDRLAHYLSQYHIDAHLITDIGDTSTVSTAAIALDVDVEQILKTLLFHIVDLPYVVISHGVSPVSIRALADHFGIGKRQIKLATPQDVLKELGYPVGGVPPIGHLSPLPVLMAESILAYDVVYGGGGDAKTMLRISVQELLRLLSPTILPLL